ncbi:hypothetical protein LSH36_1087g00012 [Paralvinella palmiformis]|uniref:Uncharacterized protein n=1 Tax=Paralvinella palmiformis TaxID=53620 RepID=A0AAD9IWE2_9ANNE|nr:hypothetical protein LSH36_1087g00012 [Paralvinella palmiformis]
MKDVLKYNLSPMSTSMYEDKGGMRIRKTKSVSSRNYKWNIQSELDPYVVIIDGIALLCVIHWPASGTRVDLRIIHEEADVIIVQQVVKLAEDGVSSIKVIRDDTDVFVLLIHYIAQEHLTCDLIMCGTSSRRVIDIKATTDKHFTIVDQLLPAHALSGSDIVSQMYGIGKGTVPKVI